RVFFDSSDPRLIKTEQRLDPVGPPEPATGLSTFRRTVRLPRELLVWTTDLCPWFSLDHRALPVVWQFNALLQVVRSDAEARTARSVTDGYDHLAKHDLGAAVETLRPTAAAAPSYAPAYRYLGDAYAELGRSAEAATAYEHLVA